MYRATEDPYCYPGTQVLVNRLNLKTQSELTRFESFITTQRADEPLPTGRLSYTHYRAIHRHLFQDIYTWAGQVRTVRISKGRSTFCYPEHINREMKKLFAALRAERYLRGLTASSFARKAAHFISELNAIHPFREGNGRTQLVFLTILAARAGHPLNLRRLRPKKILEATIKSFGGSEDPLRRVVQRLLD